jgi:hypothetical protein
MKRARKNNELEEPENKKCKINFSDLIEEITLITGVTSNKINKKHIDIIKHDINNLYNKPIFK